MRKFSVWLEANGHLQPGDTPFGQSVDPKMPLWIISWIMSQYVPGRGMLYSSLTVSGPTPRILMGRKNHRQSTVVPGHTQWKWGRLSPMGSVVIMSEATCLGLNVEKYGKVIRQLQILSRDTWRPSGDERCVKVRKTNISNWKSPFRPVHGWRESDKF